MIDKYLNKEYHCINDAAHDYNCNDYCWNSHPNSIIGDNYWNRNILPDKIKKYNDELTEKEFQTDLIFSGFTYKQKRFFK